MISHKYKCIYIHIPRTAGSNIERTLCGKDWWFENPNTKHIKASLAKKIYRPYWDDYFKFSIVRSPWARMISQYMAKIFNGHIYDSPDEDFFINHPEYFVSIDGHRCVSPNVGIKSNKGLEYFLKTYSPPIWEQESAIEYTDMLDVPLDFVGKYENLESDFNYIKQKIGFDGKLVGGPTGIKYKKFYNLRTVRLIEAMHPKSIEKFGYTFII